MNNPRSDTKPTYFFVEGIPAPQGSKKHIGGGRMIESSKKVEPWRRSVAATAHTHMPHPIHGPVSIQIVFCMPRTKKMRTPHTPPMVQRPDLDKLVRSTLDGLTGVAFTDDSQVTRIHATKIRAPLHAPTGAEIIIKEDKQP